MSVPFQYSLVVTFILWSELFIFLVKYLEILHNMLFMFQENNVITAFQSIQESEDIEVKELIKVENVDLYLYIYQKSLKPALNVKTGLSIRNLNYAHLTSIF